VERLDMEGTLVTKIRIVKRTQGPLNVKSRAPAKEGHIYERLTTGRTTLTQLNTLLLIPVIISGNSSFI
jgi:hypothetical protein